MEELDPLIGQTLGNYRVERLLGAGAMGQVFLGIHPKIDRQVAIKVLNHQMSARADMVERFLAEARAVNHIGHPNIVQVFDFGTLDDGRPYLVMEYLTGEDLKRRLERRGPMPPEEALILVRQIAAGLDAAHEAGIVHRDLKPENVFVLKAKHGLSVKLVDFGIAKVLEPHLRGGGQTSTGVIMGTPAYMSPEQAMGNTGEIGPAADVYALAVMVYQMLSGRLPFEGDFIPQILVKHVSEPPTPITRFLPQLPDGVWQALVHGLAKEPGGRPATAGDFFQELATAVRAGEATATDATATDATMMAPTTASVPTGGTVPGDAIADATVTVPGRYRLHPVAAVLALVAGALAYTLTGLPGRGPSTDRLQGFAPAPGSRAGADSPAPGQAPTLLEPADGASFTPRGRAHMLRWQPAPGQEGAMHEVQVARVAPAAVTHPAWFAPAGQPYLVIPWDRLGADGGTFRWRVRPKDTDAWSPWRAFRYAPTALARIRNDGALRVGIERIQHPPFVSWSPEQGRYTGFDIELAEALAAALGVKLELVPQDWSQLMAATLPGAYDVVISAVSITPARCQKYGFSAPYLATGQALARKTKRPTGPRDHFILGVQRNTTSEVLARARFQKADLRLFDTNDLTLEAMFKGEVEALIMDEVLITTRTDVSDWILEGELLSREGYGVMMPAAEADLKAAVDGVIAAMRADGRLAAMMKRHRIREAASGPAGLGCPE